MTVTGWIHSHPQLGAEFDWLGCDSAGSVAYFSTAGAGPIPAGILAEPVYPDDVLQMVLALPTSSEVATASVAYPKDWENASRRGLYAYDWSHRSRAYELRARPATPLLIDQLGPNGIADVARRVRLMLLFAAVDAISPETVDTSA